MKKGVRSIYDSWWAHTKHPYNVLNDALSQSVVKGKVVLEQGCGYTAPLLQQYRDRGAELIGVDVVDFEIEESGMQLIKANIEDLPLPDESVDVVFSRSVMEHVGDPGRVFEEVFRVMRPGGKWIFLTANRWDYVSVVSRLVPNKFHGALVHHTEGREEKDVFPTVYKSNSYGQIKALAKQSGMSVEKFEYLGQHPAYFAFNRCLYWLASVYEKMILKVNAFRGVRGWLLVELRKPELK